MDESKKFRHLLMWASKVVIVRFSEMFLQVSFDILSKKCAKCMFNSCQKGALRSVITVQFPLAIENLNKP